ncbi:MAG: ribosome biogenesis GTPase YlqF [Clostridia bacterium]|nr:ribosome biogenesis GTPase YlqF [Clostridia bacterium]
MLIQWFPGHMAKALREMEKSIAKVDSVIYMLDARAPFSCINPQFDNLIKNRPVLYVLNKCDLVKQEDLKAWVDYFSSNGMSVVYSNSLNGKNSAKVISSLKEVNAAKLQRAENKGVNYAVKAMVIGMPNTGKSTLINSLAKDKKTITGNKPGVTRAEQWIRLQDGIMLLDTPGTLCHSIVVERTALNLAFLGSIRDAVLDVEGLALKFVEYCITSQKGVLNKRYNVDENETPLVVYERIAKARGYLLKGGETDYSRTAATILDDFRKGRLGQVILETPYDKD